MLVPFFLSKVAHLIYTDADFERLLPIARGFDVIFRVMTVNGVDLLYCKMVPGVSSFAFLVV